MDGSVLDRSGPLWSARARGVHDIEGVVAKALASTYRPGRRSPEWVKLKTPSWRLVHFPCRRAAPKRRSLPA